MKKIFSYGLLMVLFFNLVGCKNIEAQQPEVNDDLVKVYVFEAGGCPACESQLAYLQSLDSYGEKFTIVQKELYVDHVNWALGKDFVLGVKVASAFKDYDDDFAKVSYNSTPLVIVSDIYAANGSNSGLETVINEAYEEGDKDVVACIEEHNDDCLEGYVDKTYDAAAQKVYETRSESSKKLEGTGNFSDLAMLIFVLCILVIFVVLIVANSTMSKKIAREEQEKMEKETAEKTQKEVKKTTTTKKVEPTKTTKNVKKTSNTPKPKTTTKKTTTKKTSTKTTKK